VDCTLLGDVVALQVESGDLTLQRTYELDHSLSFEVALLETDDFRLVFVLHEFVGLDEGAQLLVANVGCDGGTLVPQQSVGGGHQAQVLALVELGRVHVWLLVLEDVIRRNAIQVAEIALVFSSRFF